MPLIQWDDSFSVNVVEIDLQHKKLVGMLNELYEAMIVGKADAILGEVIDGLVRYAVIHFQTEEKYFDKFKYPKTNIHKKQHSDFTQKAAQFKDDFAQGKVCLSVEVMRFLSNWLKDHIKGSDKEYGPFFNEHGLK